TTHPRAEAVIAELPDRSVSVPAIVVERAARFTTARLLLAPPPERKGAVLTVRYDSVQAPDERVGQQVQVHLSPRRVTRQDWPEDLAPPSLGDLEWDESNHTLRREGPVSFASACAWLTGSTSPIEQALLYAVYERSNELYGTDPAIIARLDALVGRDLAAVVREVNKDGAEVALAGEEHLYG